MKRRLSVTNFSLENILLTFRLNAPVIIRVKVKRWETNITIYSHALVRTRHWRSKVGVDCSSLPASSSQQSRNQGKIKLISSNHLNPKTAVTFTRADFYQTVFAAIVLHHVGVRSEVESQLAFHLITSWQQIERIVRTSWSWAVSMYRGHYEDWWLSMHWQAGILNKSTIE